MSSQSFPIKWDKFSGAQGSTVLSASEFKKQWLLGIPLCNTLTGAKVTDEFIISKMKAAQNKVETELGIKLFKQFITETKDYIQEEFLAFGFVKTSHQVMKPVSLKGRLNEREVINYPLQWLTVRRGNDNAYWHQMNIMPNGDAQVTFSYIVASYPYYFAMNGSRFIPNFWQLNYITGFDRIPDEIIQLIGMITAVYVLPQIEFTVGNVDNRNIFLANQSLSLDGLSQSTTRLNGGNIFQNRLKDYGQQIADSLQRLRGIYGGIKFDVF